MEYKRIKIKGSREKKTGVEDRKSRDNLYITTRGHEKGKEHKQENL